MTMEGKPRHRVPPCGFCKKEFKRQEHLDRHLRTHTKERPYKCECGRSFTRQDLLHRHRRLGQCNAVPGCDGATPQSHRRLGQGQNPPFHISEHMGTSSVPGETPRSERTALESRLAGGTETMYSQGQSMASFAMPESNGETQQPVSRNQDDSFAMDTIDASGFYGLQPLDMEYLFDEADMINNHLSQDLPPLDYELSPSYSDPTSHPPNPVLDSHREATSLTSLGLVDQATTLPQASANASRLQRSPMANRNRSGRQHNRSAPGPPLEDIDETVPKNPWDVSENAYNRLSTLFADYRDPSDHFNLPSRRTISRYVASWARSYHPHLPVLHLPTKNFDCKSSMLLLTLAAVGSFYVFEHANGYPMLVVAKSVVLTRLQARQHRSSMHLLRNVPEYAKVSTRKTTSSPRADSQPLSDPFDIELLQSLLIIVMSLAWLDKPFTQEGLALSSQLAELTREALRDPDRNPDPSTWEAWAQEEERRRTIYSAYFTLNLLTICFKVPPPMPISEVAIPLPSSEAEFRALNAEAWRSVRGPSDNDQLLFSDCFKKLLQGMPLPQTHVTTEFGNYMLMQSLLAHIYFERQGSSCLLSSPSALQPSVIALYDTAFNVWQSGWDLAMDSALDPSSFHGPLAFNSTAMLRLAHVHLAIDIPAQCTLAERDPVILARAFEPDLNIVHLRTPHLHQGIMHAIKALRIPIRVGIAFVASGRTGHWSVQHAISNFYCALLLTHWLESLYTVVATDGMAGLSGEERYCLSTVERLVEETHMEEFLGEKDDYPLRIRRVAISALKLWAETCKGTQVYEIVYVVGETLARAADALEERESN
ncbi:hypothetical protein NLU13_8357 [Sarocladium strictum]|uniref:C2H2-type domain-containing protein n=1 Tax=Sarocladium strictum TaxID=5046 RepID=A0AA39GC62_SARSR|nr:hypothetical protein NLU13_8357 [Sarocladium strictum]